VVTVHEVVHGAEKDVVLPFAAEEHGEALAVAGRPDTVEARRHPSVGDDLRRGVRRRRQKWTCADIINQKRRANAGALTVNSSPATKVSVPG
jgi:hypothetical protein